MTEPQWVQPTEAQWQAADKISQLIIAALTTERGIHSEPLWAGWESA